MVTNASYTVLLHDSVTLECSVSGYPPPHSVFWIKVKDGVEILIRQPENKSNIKPKYFVNDKFLTINNAEDSDAGIYKCMAVNKETEIQSEDIYLCVFGGYQTVLESFNLASVDLLTRSTSHLKYKPDKEILEKREKTVKISKIEQLKEGMQISYERGFFKHHGIVSKVWPKQNCYEVINMTGDIKTILDKQSGIAELRKETLEFDTEQKISFYDYGEYSIDRIIRNVHNIVDDIICSSIVQKRASLMYQNFENLREKLAYKISSFNCEHFASYCATGLAFCKQKELLTKKENLRATALLDKKLTKYCEEMFCSKHPSIATLERLKMSCSTQDKSDVKDLEQMNAIPLSSIFDLAAGMNVIIKDKHHGIITDVWPEGSTFEFIHLTGDVMSHDGEWVVGCGRSKSSCQKLIMKFADEEISYMDYGNNSIDKKMKTDKSIIKIRAQTLYQVFHRNTDMTYDINNFNCEHFASYCVAGWAYRRKQKNPHNGNATRLLDSKLNDYCARLINLLE